MTHFGILCSATEGHMNPMVVLGRQLQGRGHRITLFGILDAQAKTIAAGLEFWAIAESEYPLKTTVNSLAKLAGLSGSAALHYTINLMQEGADMLLRYVPEALMKAGVEALLVDQTTIEGETIAEYLGIPFITICNALVVNPEVGVPPYFTSWSYSSAWWARLRNQAGYSMMKRFTRPITQVLDEYRQRWSLPLYSQSPHKDSFSRLAQISQQPDEFEFPRMHLPQCFHFTGPYHDPTCRESVSFPFEKLTGQPLIYASMGTLQNGQQHIFNYIAEACVGLDVQLVISLGNSLNSESMTNLPGNPLVVNYSPQLELLKKASLTITHAGLNTVLESLSNCVPMVAIPIANDQPGIAARLAWTGTGEFIPLSRLSVPRLQSVIQRVLTENSYKSNVSRLQAAIQRSGGVSRAADIIEQAISTGEPVLAYSNT
jgi:MGT family glycosyltransferase